MEGVDVIRSRRSGTLLGQDLSQSSFSSQVQVCAEAAVRVDSPIDVVYLHLHRVQLYN